MRSGAEGEDLVEKQNAEQGLMPVIEDEAGIYGYTDENRHMVEAFRRGHAPAETFHDGVGVMEMLMGLYRSAELGRAVFFSDPELEGYVPVVARGGGVECFSEIHRDGDIIASRCEAFARKIHQRAK